MIFILSVRVATGSFIVLVNKSAIAFSKAGSIPAAFFLLISIPQIPAKRIQSRPTKSNCGEGLGDKGNFQLLGFVGVLMALPASAVLLVALRRLRQRYVGSRLYAD